MTENEAIEVLKDFGKQVTVKADGAYQSTIGQKACNVAIKALEEIQRWHTSVINPNIKNEFANTSTQICHNCDHKDEYIEELEAEVEPYRTIEKDLKERYHANVDIPLLMHHFIETVFEGEKHEGFCLLTNEDREAWEEYKAIGTPEELQKAEKEENILKFYYCDSEDSYLIGRRVGNFYYAHYLDGSWVFDMSRYLPWGIYINEYAYPSEPREINFSEWLKGFVKKECGGTPEECRAAMEKQTAISREVIEGKYFCPKCHNLTPYPGYCGCGQRLY